MSDHYNQLLCCPDCHAALDRTGNSLTCRKGHRFALSALSIPQLLPTTQEPSPLWQEWEAKQAEGLKDYSSPDDHYHEVSDGVARLFGSFVGWHGKVLDIGCGIQPTLAYVPTSVYEQVDYLGLDPMLATTHLPFAFVQGLAERLPIKSGSIDQVILATSLDHMLDCSPVFQEAQRVLKPGGEIVIWSTIIEYIPAADIRVGQWVKEIVYLMSRCHFQRAWRRFLLPYPVAGLDYQPTDRYHFHRFTRESIHRLFAEEGWRVVEEYSLEDPINLGSKHLFARLQSAKEGSGDEAD